MYSTRNASGAASGPRIKYPTLSPRPPSWPSLYHRKSRIRAKPGRHETGPDVLKGTRVARSLRMRSPASELLYSSLRSAMPYTERV